MLFRNFQEFLYDGSYKLGALQNTVFIIVFDVRCRDSCDHIAVFSLLGKGYTILISWYSDSLREGRSWDRMPVGARFSAPVQTGLGPHPAFYTLRTGSFLRIKRPESGVEHPHQITLGLKEEKSNTSFGSSWPFIGEIYLLFYLTYYYVKADRIFQSTLIR